MRGSRVRTITPHWVAAVLAAFALVIAGAATNTVAQAQPTTCASEKSQGKAPPNPRAANCHVPIQFLWVSDWHAQLDPLFISGQDVGGAAAISTYWQHDRAAFDGPTITFTAGDAYGASPPLAGFFDEVPGVLAQRLMGFDVDTFGNHNFDAGIEHLQQMIDLAAAPAGVEPGTPFQYVSANLENRDDNLSGVSDYALFEVHPKVTVAVIGLTNEEAPTLVFPGNFGTIEVTDAADAANRAREDARRDGANVFVIITHKGVTGFDAAGDPVGPLIDLANEVEGFHAIFGDHTDVQFEGVINGQPVLENRSKGATYGRTVLTVDRRNGSLVSHDHEFVVPVTAAVDPDPAIEAMLEPFRDELADAFDGVIGVATDTFPRGGTPAVERVGEVALGNLITDSMRLRYDADIAFTNGGGIRTPLPSDYVPRDTTLRRPPDEFADGPPWDLVVGDVFATLPFGNAVITRTVTGALLWEILEHGVAQMPSADGRFPQVSGFSFTYDVALPPGARVIEVELDDGTPVLPDGTLYTLATNDFVNAGGDGYTMLSTDPGDSVTREVMADVLLEHIEALGTVTPVIEGRITRLN